MWRAWVLVIAACGGASAPPPDEPAGPKRDVRAAQALLEEIRARRARDAAQRRPPPAVMPRLLPQETIGTRWPLLRAPLLAPHLDLSRAYDVTSEWTALCHARGLPTSLDPQLALDYLLAWCQADAHPRRARDLLVAMRASAPRPIAAAIARELVDFAVELEPSAAAAMAAVNFEPALLDALATTYLMRNRPADARAVADVLEGVREPSAVVRCRRIARMIDLDGPWSVPEVAQLAAQHDVCRALYEDLHCPLITGTPARGRTHEHDVLQCTRVLAQRADAREALLRDLRTWRSRLR